MDDSLRERFTREALAAARLSGEPSALTIFDVGEWNGRPFIVMEYLDGGSLQEARPRRRPRRRSTGSRRRRKRWTPPTGTGSCTATSSPGTCSWARTGACASGTSASRAPRAWRR